MMSDLYDADNHDARAAPIIRTSLMTVRPVLIPWPIHDSSSDTSSDTSSTTSPGPFEQRFFAPSPVPHEESVASLIMRHSANAEDDELLLVLRRSVFEQ